MISSAFLGYLIIVAVPAGLPAQEANKPGMGPESRAANRPGV